MKRVFLVIIAGCLLLPALPAAAAATRTVCASGCDHTTIAAAVTAAAAGDTIDILEDQSVSAVISVGKTLTITSSNEVLITRTGTSAGTFSISSAGDGTTISNLEITSAGVVGGAFINVGNGANDVTLDHNTIYGPQQAGPMASWVTNRGWINGAVTGLQITDNVIHTLRTGGYIDGGSGSISGNVTYNTKGDYLLSGQSDFGFTDNAAGYPTKKSEWGIVIFAANNIPYDVQALGAANDCLTVWDQGTNETYIDSDCDGVPDPDDAFPEDPDETTNSDTDSVGDNADNCDTVDNDDQADLDEDGEGDACDADRDGDGIPNDEDAFPDTLNDDDNDGVEDTDAPTSADQCKKNGWMAFNNPTFKNQGDCVSYVNTGK